MKLRNLRQLAHKAPRLAGAALLAMMALKSHAMATDILERPASEGPQGCYLKDISDRALCGVVTVPENPAQPEGKQIDIHYAVLPAIKPSFPGEAFLAIAGGPGQSAIDNAAGFNSMFRKVRQTRDILLIDQRGTGRSNLLACSDNGLDPLAVDDENADMIAETRACLATQNADISQYGSVTALSDFEAVRKALGYQKLHVYGVSYGSRMGQLYLRHYPEALATVTLDGVVPMQQSVLAIGEAIDRAVALLLKDCAGNAACQARFPQLADELATVHSRLAQSPADIGVNHPLTGEPQQFLLTRSKFAGVVRLALYSPTTRALLPLAIHEAAKGNYQSILGLYGMTLGSLDLASGMHNSVVCGEDMHRIDADLQQRLQQSYYGKLMLDGLQKACSVWQVPAMDANFADAVDTKLPVLLLSGELDPATPPSWAEMAMANMPNARHLVAPYSGHGIARESCASGIIAEFVSEGAVDALETDCLKKDIRRGFYLNASTVEPLPAVSPLANKE